MKDRQVNAPKVLMTDASMHTGITLRQPAYEHQQEKYQDTQWDKEDNIGHLCYPREHEEFLTSKSKTACFPVWCATLKIRHPSHSVWERVGVRVRVGVIIHKDRLIASNIFLRI